MKLNVVNCNVFWIVAHKFRQKVWQSSHRIWQHQRLYRRNHSVYIRISIRVMHIESTRYQLDAASALHLQPRPPPSAPADRKDDAQRRQPPHDVPAIQRPLQQHLVDHGDEQQQRRKAAGDEGHEARCVSGGRVGELVDVVPCSCMAGRQAVSNVVRQLVELPQPPLGQGRPPPGTCSRGKLSRE